MLKYESPPNSSFRVICEGYAQAVRANFAKAKAAGLPTTMTEIENAVDLYNSTICKQNGWTQYLQEGPSQQAPFSRPRPFQGQPSKSLFQSARQNVAGVKTLVEWIISGAEAVPKEQANHRAEVCVKCPLNKQGELSAFFTVPVAVAIRKALEDRKTMNLSTPVDSQLGTCEACGCVNALKVHVPFQKFFPKMLPESKAALPDSCWIISESKIPITP